MANIIPFPSLSIMKTPLLHDKNQLKEKKSNSKRKNTNIKAFKKNNFLFSECPNVPTPPFSLMIDNINTALSVISESSDNNTSLNDPCILFAQSPLPLAKIHENQLAISPLSGGSCKNGNADFHFLDNEENIYEQNSGCDKMADVTFAESNINTSNAINVLKNILHLAAVGSSKTQRIAKAILVESMSNNKVEQYLLASGYAKKNKHQSSQINENKICNNKSIQKKKATTYLKIIMKMK